MAAPVIWSFSAEHTGMRVQAEGLARELAAVSGGSTTHYPVTLPRAAHLLPARAAAYFCRWNSSPSDSPPDIIIGCGKNGQAALHAAKHRTRAYTIYIQRPSGNPAQFDTIIAPAHDYPNPPYPPNVIRTLGAIGGGSCNAPHPPDTARFTGYPPPLIGILIGGDNRAYTLNDDQLLQHLIRIADSSGGTLLITPSRRTRATLCRQLQQTFAPRHYVWDSTGENPYHAILAAADYFCVTADSVNMISEASGSGKGVYLLPLTEKTTPRARRAAKKFTAFHTALQDRGNLRFFSDTTHCTPFTAPPLNETRQVAEELWERYRQG